MKSKKMPRLNGENFSVVFGRQMKKARDVNSMSQEEASKALKISVSYLSKIENGYLKEVSFSKLAVPASMLYDVSLDFLAGLTEDWERDAVVAQKREIASFILIEYQRSRANELNKLWIMANKINELEKTANEVINLISHGNRIVAQLISDNSKDKDYLTEINPINICFKMMHEKTRSVKREIEKYHMQNNTHANTSTVLPEPPLFDFAV